MTGKAGQPNIDWVTVVGLGLILLPLTTMWHEIGGHAATCVVLRGKLTEIGAFYVNCDSTSVAAQVAVSCAGAAMDVVLALIAWSLWKRVTGDLPRLTCWYVAVSKGFVAAGYLAFSGVTGFGDFGTDQGNGLAVLPAHTLVRVALLVVGALAYWRLYLIGARTLAAMIGQGLETRTARRTIAHVYYLALGLDAVLIGLVNPIGFLITVMSAAASSFGGNAGLISIGYATSETGEARDFRVDRHWYILVVGVIISLSFAAVLGPSIKL